MALSLHIYVHSLSIFTWARKTASAFIRYFRGSFVAIALLSSTFCQVARAQISLDPAIDWKAIETPHFSILFDSKHQELAGQYALSAERAFASLNPIFKDTPSKTVIVVNDSTDLANGFAMSVPYPMIHAFPVMPSSMDSIGDFAFWGDELILHEYTHILNFEPARGVFKPLRYVFGSIIRPGMLLPRWFQEGLAVEMETRFSHNGRLRAPQIMATARTMALAGRFNEEDIARANETSIPDWPGGSRPYLFGSFILADILKQKGVDAAYRLNERYGARMPYFINQPLIDELGIGYNELLKQIFAQLTSTAAKHKTVIEKHGLWEPQMAQQRGFLTHDPILSPNGNRLLTIEHEHNKESLLVLRERSSESRESFGLQKGRVLAEPSATSRASWLSNSTHFVYDQVDTVRRYSELSDLWRYDLNAETKRHRKQRLTKGFRAREAVVSPDDKKVVFVQNFAGGTKLAMIEAPAGETFATWPKRGELVSEEQIHVLYTPPLQVRIARPEFLPTDNGQPTEIVFIENGPTNPTHVAQDRMIRMRLQDLTSREFLADECPCQYPRSIDLFGSKRLLFSSSKLGVSNLLLASADFSRVDQVTNTIGHILQSEWDQRAGEWLVVDIDAHGPLLKTAKATGGRTVTNPVGASNGSLGTTNSPSVTINTFSKLEQPLPLLAPDERPVFTRAKNALQDADGIERIPESQDYWALPYLIPRYWTPFVYFLPEGGVLSSASVASSDPVGHHAYGLTAEYDTSTRRPNYFATYTNSQTPVQLTLLGQDSFDQNTAANYRRHNTVAALRGLSFIPGLDEKWRAGLGWTYSQIAVDDNPSVRQGPNASIVYADATQKGNEISPEKGGHAVLTQTNYIPSLGHLGYEQSDLNAAKFLSQQNTGILPERHVLAGFLRATWAPRLNNALLGASTASVDSQAIAKPTSYLMRGYAAGTFIGPSLFNATLEYRFPLLYPQRGVGGTAPFFFRRLHAALFADAVTTDGFYYASKQKQFIRTRLNHNFYSGGLELRADMTFFYHLPVQIVYGIAFASHRDAATDTQPITYWGLGI